jgi:hypothetical protein
MAGPTRSKRKAERARGAAPRKPKPVPSWTAGGRGAARNAAPLSGPVGKVPAIAKVGFSALLILLVVYLISLGR